MFYILFTKRLVLLCLMSMFHGHLMVKNLMYKFQSINDRPLEGKYVIVLFRVKPEIFFILKEYYMVQLIGLGSFSMPSVFDHEVALKIVVSKHHSQLLFCTLFVLLMIQKSLVNALIVMHS